MLSLKVAGMQTAKGEGGQIEKGERAECRSRLACIEQGEKW